MNSEEQEHASDSVVEHDIVELECDNSEAEPTEANPLAEGDDTTKKQHNDAPTVASNLKALIKLPKNAAADNGSEERSAQEEAHKSTKLGIISKLARSTSERWTALPEDMEELPDWCMGKTEWERKNEANAISVWNALDIDEACRVVDRVPTAMLITTGAPGYHIVKVNSHWEKITGFEEQDAVGSGTACLQGPGTNQNAVDELQKQLRRGEAGGATFTNYRRNKQRFTNHLRVIPMMLDAQGRRREQQTQQAHQQREQQAQQAHQHQQQEGGSNQAEAVDRARRFQDKKVLAVRRGA